MPIKVRLPLYRNSRFISMVSIVNADSHEHENRRAQTPPRPVWHYRMHAIQVIKA
jgi:hypothetical protein